MSTAVRERTTTHTSRKIVSHGLPMSGQSHGVAANNSLENNLDALLEDLQTSVSRSATPSRGRTLSPQVEYRVAANPTRVVSEGRAISPSRTTTTTTEKFVSSGPSGVPSGIPGLEMLDAELQNVQPGQSKTVAYKQVSYQYNKSYDGKPVETWTTPDNALTGPPLIDDVREATYEESRIRRRSPEPVGKSQTVNRELLYSDTSTSRSRQPSPLPGAQRDVKYVHETTTYQADPRPIQNVTLHSATTTQDYPAEAVPVPSPTPAIPINLAPGPNTKVTTTIKTYTYELPGAPETYLPSGGSLPRVLPGDQTITYTLPRTEKITYQSESLPSKYPEDQKTITQKTIHKESKFYREEHHGVQPVYPTAIDGPGKRYPSDGEPMVPHGGGNIYQNQPLDTTTTTIVKTEDKLDFPNRPRGERVPIGKGGSTNTTVYKYSNTTSTVPPSRNADDHEVLLPKFPTGDGGSPGFPMGGGPRGGGNEQVPPAKLEDLMASFSDSEREVLEDIEKQEKERQKKESSVTKKEVDFVGHTPAKVKSKNVAGPPVYYPPGSAEFTKKEEAGMAMSQSSGGWQKASGKYEYEASSKSKSKSSSGGAVVPVCLPLCCALPCVIM